MTHANGPPLPRTALRADCGSCAGLCCVAPAFTASADFAASKPAGQPCANLRDDSRCGIHTELRDRGFPGCTVFDCFGAGQRTIQHTYDGDDWRQHPHLADQMFTVFGVLRQLHEHLWYLAEALTLAPAGSALHRATTQLRARTTAQASAPPATVAQTDLAAWQRQTGELLDQISQHARAGAAPAGTDTGRHRGADLIGKDLRNAPLRGTSLRGAYLLGADLRGADLDRTDLLGADLRAADLRGTDLSTALFLTQPQLTAARGDAATTIPAALDRPGHWPTTATSATSAEQPDQRPQRTPTDPSHRGETRSAGTRGRQQRTPTDPSHSARKPGHRSRRRSQRRPRPNT